LTNSKREHSICQLEYAMESNYWGKKKGGVNVQAKDLVEAGCFGRGKLGDYVVQANPRD
jgi:hypothetical protein